MASQEEPPSAVALDPKSLDDLDQAIRGATSAEVAEKLSKQVRALKVVQAIRERDGELVSRAEVEMEHAQRAAAYRAGLLNIKGLATVLVGLTAKEIATVLEAEAIKILHEMFGTDDAVAGAGTNSPGTMDGARAA